MQAWRISVPEKLTGDTGRFDQRSYTLFLMPVALPPPKLGMSCSTLPSRAASIMWGVLPATFAVFDSPGAVLYRRMGGTEKLGLCWTVPS